MDLLEASLEPMGRLPGDFPCEVSARSRSPQDIVQHFKTRAMSHYVHGEGVRIGERGEMLVVIGG